MPLIYAQGSEPRIDTLHRLGGGAEALGWPSPRHNHASAWHGHVSFAHWLVQAMRPAVIVELGAHNGVSYAAFCNAVARLQLPARCFAIDCWEGDDHAGHYGEEVYQDLLRFNQTHCAGFSILIRAYFDQALDRFADGAIDLLHIDGLHTYEAARHDFETWRPKLSDRAVVLFHDTDVLAGDFGVWRLWDELTNRYPGFRFHHAAGLGVLAVGRHVAPAIQALCTSLSDRQAQALRALFAESSRLAQRGQGDPPQVIERPNLALGCHTMQSSGHPSAAPTTASAVCGIKDGGFGFHTDLEPRPWWMLDLGERRQISEITLYNRLDPACIHRAASLVLLSSENAEAWETLYEHDGTRFGGADGAPLQIRCDGVLARFIRLRLQTRDYLHLDEVEVY
jgi:hypothetical protein